MNAPDTFALKGPGESSPSKALHAVTRAAKTTHFWWNLISRGVPVTVRKNREHPEYYSVIEIAGRVYFSASFNQ